MRPAAPHTAIVVPSRAHLHALQVLVGDTPNLAWHPARGTERAINAARTLSLNASAPMRQHQRLALWLDGDPRDHDQVAQRLASGFGSRMHVQLILCNPGLLACLADEDELLDCLIDHGERTFKDRITSLMHLVPMRVQELITYATERIVTETIEGEMMSDGMIYCAECGEELEADSSPGVWVHSRELGDKAYDLDEQHSARPEDEDTPHPYE